MLVFDLDLMFVALSSDDGPVFGHLGIATDRWPVANLRYRKSLVRAN